MSEYTVHYLFQAGQVRTLTYPTKAAAADGARALLLSQDIIGVNAAPSEVFIEEEQPGQTTSDTL